MERGGMRRGLIEERMIGQGDWGMRKRESLLSEQMMIAFPGVAWMRTEVPDVALMKTGSLAGEQMMTGLPGVVQMMTGLPGELAMKTGEAGVMRMMTDHLDGDWMRTEEAGEQLMRTEDQDVGWMRTGGHGEEVQMTSGLPGVMLTTIGVPGAAWMMTGVRGVGWMMIEDLGGMLMMTEFPDVVQMMTGGLGETQMMIGFPEGARTQGLVPGDHLSSQVDGERKKRPEKRVGVHLENRDHQKNVNGIEKKKESEITKIVMKMTRTQRKKESEKGTESERGIEKTASDGRGMKVAGEEDQRRNLRAGEIQLAEMIGIGMTVVGREMIAVT